MSKGKIALGAVVGAVAGFVTGILTAPKSGKETQADVKEAAIKLKSSATTEAAKLKESGEEFVKNAQKGAQDVLNDVGERADDLKTRTNNAVEGAKKGFFKNTK